LAQIFKKRANRVPLLLLGGGAAAAAVAVFGIWYYFSPEFTDVGYQPVQPVPFSHKLHAGDLGIDCRYCHSQVEVSAVATIPPTQTCMNCHRLVKTDSPKLAPVRDSFAKNEPLRWVRVHQLPQYAYFDHSVHIRAGVGCSSCHGDIASMEVIAQAKPLSMGWCLSCHRAPDLALRPAAELTDTAWQPPKDQLAFAAKVKAERHLAPPEDCSSCHR
jgi:Cytochrome c7 and related cytochrome c/Class III cytochrome C family